MSSSLGKTTSPTLSMPQSPEVLCVGVRPWGLVPVHSDMSIGVVLVPLTFGQSHWRDFVGVVSDIPRRYSLTTNWFMGGQNLYVCIWRQRITVKESSFFHPVPSGAHTHSDCQAG